MLPLPEGDTHVDVLFLVAVLQRCQRLRLSLSLSQSETGVLAEFSGDGRYVSARLFGSVDGPRHAELWGLHKHVYAFNDPEQPGPTAPPTITPVRRRSDADS